MFIVHRKRFLFGFKMCMAFRDIGEYSKWLKNTKRIAKVRGRKAIIKQDPIYKRPDVIRIKNKLGITVEHYEVRWANEYYIYDK
jgi:hypothetical protein